MVFIQNICTPVLLPLTQLALLKERNQHVFIRAYLHLTVHFHRATLPEINGLLAAPILLCHRHNRLLEVEISVQLYQVFRNPSLTNGPEFEV